MPWLNEDTVYPASTGKMGGNSTFFQPPYPVPTSDAEHAANWAELTRWANNMPKPNRIIISASEGAIVPGDGTRTYVGTANIDSGQAYFFSSNANPEPITSLVYYSDPSPYGYGSNTIRKWVGKGGGIISVKFYVEAVTISGDPYGTVNELSFTPRDGDIAGVVLEPLTSVVEYP